MTSAIAVSVLIALACGYAVLVVWSSFYHRRIRSARSGITIESFAEEFADGGCTREVLEAAFEDFVARVGSPVHRVDSLLETFGLDDEDVEDMLSPRLAAKGMTWQDVSQSPLRALPLRTVDDYVRFLAELARLPTSGSGR